MNLMNVISLVVSAYLFGFAHLGFCYLMRLICGCDCVSLAETLKIAILWPSFLFTNYRRKALLQALMFLPWHTHRQKGMTREAYERLQAPPADIRRGKERPV
jgi:hypothetical protein